VSAEQFSFDRQLQLRELLTRLPLPVARAVRDQLESELLESKRAVAEDLDAICRCKMKMAEFQVVVHLQRNGRTKLRTLRSLAELCAALERREVEKANGVKP
jgi:hypothetical protein